MTKSTEKKKKEKKSKELPSFYFFGLKRKEKSFLINDPITVNKNEEVYSINADDWESYYRDMLSKYIEEDLFERSTLFIIPKSFAAGNKFLKHGTLLSPLVKITDTSFFCLDDKKLIIFKINRQYRDFNTLKEDIINTFTPLKIMKSEEIKAKIEEKISFNHREKFTGFSIETEKVKIIGQCRFSTIGTIQSKEYSKIKITLEKIKKIESARTEIKTSKWLKKNTK